MPAERMASLFEEDLAMARMFENLDVLLASVAPSDLTVIEVVGMVSILVQVLPRFVVKFFGELPISYIADGGRLARERLAWCLDHVKREYLRAPELLAMIALLRPVAARIKSSPLARVTYLYTGIEASCLCHDPAT